MADIPIALTSSGLLEGLLSIPSTSGNEAAAVSWLCERMDALGFSASIDGAGNAVGTRGSGDTELLLLGHIDTVPGDIPVRIEDGVLFGRGAVDAKGPLAAFVAAAARATVPAGVRLTVIGAVGEETFGSPGATWLCEHYPAPDAVIIGEPSGWDGIVLGYKGSLGMTATIRRPLTHSAGPDTTAPESAFRFWIRLTSWLAGQNNGASPGFETIDGTLRGIDSGHDGLHEWATLQATFRLPPGVESGWVREQVTRFAGEAELSWHHNAEAYRTDKRSPLVAPFMGAIRAAGGKPRLKVKTGTSDMNLVGPTWNCPIIAYGPGDASFDHTPNEQISLAEFERGVGVLTQAIETWAGMVRSGRVLQEQAA
jgi:[amino group carrier protein]-lysine/ornithine hydrolase